jgi:hypothetical protein
MAAEHFRKIREKVIHLQTSGQEPSGRWINDTSVFSIDDIQLGPGMPLGGVIDFVPAAAQVKVSQDDNADEDLVEAAFNTMDDKARAVENGLAAGVAGEGGNLAEDDLNVETSHWCRLCDFAGAAANGAVVFDDVYN